MDVDLHPAPLPGLFALGEPCQGQEQPGHRALERPDAFSIVGEAIAADILVADGPGLVGEERTEVEHTVLYEPHLRRQRPHEVGAGEVLREQQIPDRALERIPVAFAIVRAHDPSLQGGHRDRLLRLSEVAERLAISRSFAFKIVATGELRSIRIGRAVRVRPADLEEYLDAAVREG